VLTRLRQISGVQSIIEFRADPGLPTANPQLQGFPAAVVPCAQLASAPGLGRCPAGVAAAEVPASLLDFDGTLADSIGIGFGASAMYATMEMHLSLVAPGAAYFVLTAARLVLALALIAATFSLLRRITGPETARSE